MLTILVLVTNSEPVGQELDAGSRTDVRNVVEWSTSLIHSLTLDPELTLGT